MRTKYHWDDKDLQEYVSRVPIRFLVLDIHPSPEYSMIDDQAMSKQMEDIPLEEDDIKRLPKKVFLHFLFQIETLLRDPSFQLRKYYENMALLKEAYTEVDELLASSLPSTIVTSFKPAANSLEPDFLRGNDEDLTSSHTWPKPDTNYGSLLTPHDGYHQGSITLNDGPDHGAGEDVPLLPNSQQREEKREKLNKLALNGKPLRPQSGRSLIHERAISQFRYKYYPPRLQGPRRPLINQYLPRRILHR